MHSLLKRQLKRHWGEGKPIPPEWQPFIAAVNNAYEQSDADRGMLERSLEISSHELVQANSEMRAIFQAIPDMLFRLDHEGRILDFKAGHTADLMLQRQELFGKRIQDIPLKKIGEQFREAIRRVAETGAVASMEYSLNLQGQDCFYEARFVPLMESQIFAIIRNITERQKAAEEIRVAHQRFLDIIDFLPDATFVVDQEKRVIAWNRAIEEMSGVKKSDIIGKGEYAYALPFYGARRPLLVDLMGVSDEEIAQHGYRSIHRQGHTHYAELYVQHVFGGRGAHLWVMATPFYDWQGNQVGAIESIRDITERVLAEAELFQSRQMLRTVLDNIPQRVYWKDEALVFAGCNRAMAQDCGLKDSAEIVGKRDADLAFFGMADEHRADDLNLLSTGEPKLNFEVLQSLPDGGQRWLRVSKVPLHGQDGRVIGLLGTLEDVTEVKRLETQYRQAQKMDAFGQLAAGVAHDFNNILTVVQGNASLLRSLLAGLSSDESLAAVQEITRAAERAAKLTRQLLTFSRRQPIQPKNVDLNQVVADITRMLQRLIGEHIALVTYYAPGGAPVHADPGMLEQVIMNLAVNSRDAMPQGGQLVLHTAIVSLDEQQARKRIHGQSGLFVRLSVEDTGTGITPEHLAHIFEPFFTTKDVGKGTGLGLATVFGIVEQHRGWIDVVSKVGVGTTFHIFFPHAQLALPAAEVAEQFATMTGGTETIMVVEDEMAVCKFIERVLTNKGYKVCVASSGKEALAQWAQRRAEVDLLLTDMVMPHGISGRALADRLTADKPGLKVLYCTGYSDDMLGKSSPRKGGLNLLEKPFGSAELLKKIREILDAR